MLTKKEQQHIFDTLFKTGYSRCIIKQIKHFDKLNTEAIIKKIIKMTLTDQAFFDYFDNFTSSQQALIIKLLLNKPVHYRNLICNQKYLTLQQKQKIITYRIRAKDRYVLLYYSEEFTSNQILQLIKVTIEQGHFDKIREKKEQRLNRVDTNKLIALFLKYYYKRYMFKILYQIPWVDHSKIIYKISKFPNALSSLADYIQYYKNSDKTKISTLLIQGWHFRSLKENIDKFPNRIAIEYELSKKLREIKEMFISIGLNPDDYDFS